MKNITRFCFLLVFLSGSQSFGATYTGPGGALTPPGLTSGVVTFPFVVAGEPGSVIPGGTVPDIMVPAVLGYNTQITNITLVTAQHTFASDLDLRLISPGGVIYTFNTDNGGSTGLDVASDVIFDITSTDCADTWTSSTSATQPENGMLFETSENTCGPIDTTFSFQCVLGVGEINGDEVNGNWILEITDDAGGDTGSFVSFSITFDTMTPPAMDTGGTPIDPASCMTPPDAPTLGTVTPGDSSFTVAFTPPANDGGSPILDYTATCDTIPDTTDTGSPILVGGLTNGVTYMNCAVTARNAVGSSVPSATFSVTPVGDQTITGFMATPSSGVLGGSSALSATASSGLPVTFGSTTPGVCTVMGTTVDYIALGTCTVTADQAGSVAFNPAPQVTLNIAVGANVPGAPVIDSIEPGLGMLTVFFTPPASDGGSPITNYRVTCDGFTMDGLSSPIVLNGLPDGRDYSCTIAAENATGFGPPSAPVIASIQVFAVPSLSIWGQLLLVLGLILIMLHYSRRRLS